MVQLNILFLLLKTICHHVFIIFSSETQDLLLLPCAKYDGRLPEYNISASGIMVLCKACDKYLELRNEDSRLGQSAQDNDQDVTKMIIAFCKQPHSAKEIMEYIKINDRSFFRRHYLNPMIKTGQLKMTIPDKPKSGNQKYYV